MKERSEYASAECLYTVFTVRAAGARSCNVGDERPQKPVLCCCRTWLPLKAAEKEDSSWPSASFWWLPTVASDPRLVALWLLCLLCHMSRVSVSLSCLMKMLVFGRESYCSEPPALNGVFRVCFQKRPHDWL